MWLATGSLVTAWRELQSLEPRCSGLLTSTTGCHAPASLLLKRAINGSWLALLFCSLSHEPCSVSPSVATLHVMTFLQERYFVFHCLWSSYSLSYYVTLAPQTVLDIQPWSLLRTFEMRPTSPHSAPTHCG